MTSVAQLPHQALLMIAQSASDLLTLHSLRCSSTLFSGFFADDSIAFNILDSVIASSLTPCVQDTVRLTCLALGHPLSSWDDVEQLCMRLDQRNVLLLQETQETPEIHSVSVRMLLALSKCVHSAAYRCLETLLSRCRTLRPRRPTDIRYDDDPAYFWDYSPGKPFEMRYIPFEEPVPFGPLFHRARSPPFVAEEGRALYGAWSLACFSVVRSGLRKLHVPLPSIMHSPLAFWMSIDLPTDSDKRLRERLLSTFVYDDDRESNFFHTTEPQARPCLSLNKAFCHPPVVLTTMATAATLPYDYNTRTRPMCAS